MGDEGHPTPLHLPAQHGRVEVVHVLLQHGANVGTKDRSGRTALHQAAEYGKVEVVQVLLQHGVDVGTKDGKGRTALQVASDRGHDEIMKLLSEHRVGEEHVVTSRFTVLVLYLYPDKEYHLSFCDILLYRM